MAVTSGSTRATGGSKSEDAAATAKPAQHTDEKVEDAPGTTVKTTSRAEKIEAGQCVVDDGTLHMGRAVNGVICSAHAMRYHSDGTKRGEPA